MTTEALRRTPYNPVHISPSDIRKQIGEGVRRLLFSSSTPDIRRDIERANNRRDARPQEPNRGISRRDVLLVAGTSVTTAGLVVGGQAIYNKVFADEPISEPVSASIKIDSFPNSFNNPEGPQLVPTAVPQPVRQLAEIKQAESKEKAVSASQPQVEIKKAIPKEIFDNTTTKTIFTEDNSVAITPKQYQDTSPRLINGDSVVIPLPIELPKGQQPNISFKKEKDKTFGGKRLINGRLDPEKKGQIISDGSINVNNVGTLDNIPPGSVFFSAWEGEIQFSTSSGYENPDGSLPHAEFFIFVKDPEGNSATLIAATTKVKPLFKPSHSELDERGTTKPIPKKPLEVGDSLVEFLNPDYPNRTPDFEGQLHITVLSSVVKDGQRRGGAAEIQIATTPEGQGIRLERGSESK